MFKRHNWRYYTEDPHDLVKQKLKPAEKGDDKPITVIILSGVLALETSNLVALHIWMMFGADKFLLDRVGDHLDINGTIRNLVSLCERWPEAKAKVIEGQANGPAVISLLQRRIPGLISWPPKGVPMDSKVARAVAMQPNHEAGNIWE